MPPGTNWSTYVMLQVVRICTRLEAKRGSNRGERQNGL
jgi:hypothetical protein